MLDDPIEHVTSLRPDTPALITERREALWSSASGLRAEPASDGNGDVVLVPAAPEPAHRDRWRAATAAVAAALLLAVLALSSTRNERAGTGAGSATTLPDALDGATTAAGPMTTVAPTTAVTARRPFAPPDCSVPGHLSSRRWRT